MKIFGWKLKFAGYWAKPFVYGTYVPAGYELPDGGEAYRLGWVNIGPFVIVREG